MQRRATFVSKLLVRLAFTGFAWGVVACSDDAQQTEEPVQPIDVKEGAIAPGEDEGGANAEADGAEAPPSEEKDDLDAAMSDEAPAIPEPEAPVVPEPIPVPSTPKATPTPMTKSNGGGGIISSGTKSDAWEECKKVVKFSQRKACFEAVLKAQKKKKK